MLIVPEGTGWGDGSRPFRRGDWGWPVVALQINLNRFGNQLEPDGDLGPATETVARAFQAHRGLRVDGVIGPQSQQRMCLDLAGGAVRRYALPDGLARGLMENESGFMVAAYTTHPSDAGFDLGAWQDSYEWPGTQAAYRDSLDVHVTSHKVIGGLRATYDRYRSGGASARLGWECAALSHNWPVGADRVARGLGPTVRPDEPAGWVERASGGRLHTPREWAESYIANATRHVDWASLTTTAKG